ncbi:MAG: VIT domain-containing protein [Gammaproteobacteria bacterium]|nr:VIT domain-containing protein [Gammaproteobacteria bacterium]MDH5654127.1 VIT domain-containing protein [Gammaproteobacteria bacterium]
MMNINIFVPWQHHQPRQFTPDSVLPYIAHTKGEATVTIQSLDIQVQITGLYAQTTQTLIIHNPNNRAMEGNVCFPLPDGAVVCDYALDIGGKLVDGVVVPKQKARQILEAEERKGADPGLVEQVQGNVYRTRVYPVAPNSSRTVRVTYIDSLTVDGNNAAYHLPLVHAEHIGEVSLRVEVAQSPVQPILSGGIGNMSLKQAKQCWVAEATLREGTPTDDLLIRLPDLPDRFTMLEQTTGGETFFCISARLNETGAQTETWTPLRIGIAWDASGSRYNNIERDLELLTTLLAHWPDTVIDLLVFRNEVEEELKSFKGSDGDELIQYLRRLPYDGGTCLSDLALESQTKPETEAWLLFSDGMATLNTALPEMGKTKLFTISSTTHCNSALLGYLSETGGGLHINLLQTTSEAAARQICQTAPPPVIDSEAGCEANHLINQPGRCTVVGRLSEATGHVNLSVNDDVHQITLDGSSATTGRLLARAWAGLEARKLSLIEDEGADSLVQLGRSYGLVTPGTSLLVLESLSQYLEYRVEPPSSLPGMQADYHRNLNDREKEKADTEKHHLQRVIQLWEERIRWWETKFETNPVVKENKKILEDPFAAGAVFTSEESIDPLMNMSMSSDMSMDMMDDQVMRSAPRRRAMAAAAGSAEAQPKISADDEETRASITIKPWSPDTPYLNAIKMVDREQAYHTYLAQRRDYTDSPSFYLDCGDYFLGKGELKLGKRILSNLLEQGLDDPALMRIYGRRLQQADQLDEAVAVFSRILAQRDDEPQSHRDLALALDRRWQLAGRREDVERAMSLLYSVIKKDWPNFPEIEIIALMELNRLLEQARKQDIPAPEEMDPRLQKNLHLDLRISMSWDADLTDVDLHVFEPSGEHAYYGYNQTRIGGLVSRDFTQGYGPEEYVLHHAMPGKYIIKAHYYGSHQQTLTGPCTVTATVFTNYARDSEQQQTLTLRLDSPSNDVVVGEVTIDGKRSNNEQISNEQIPEDRFRNLKKGMSIDEVVEQIGQPENITGSEEMMMIYRPAAGIEVQVVMGPKLTAVRHITDDVVIDLI